MAEKSAIVQMENIIMKKPDFRLDVQPLQVESRPVDPGNLTRYKEVCGYRSEDQPVVPLCYLECLFIKSLVILAVSGKSQLAPLGLIHIRQTITVYEKLDDLLSLSFDLSTNIIGYREVERGIEADVKIGVYTKQQRCVWEGQITLLSRNPRAQRGGEHKHKTQTTNEDVSHTSVVEIPVSSDTGIRYAKVTGDWSPHHLYTWSARLLGYKQPIAHGMWTLARTLAEIQHRVSEMRYPIYIDASFKRPLYMPSTCITQLKETSSTSHSFKVIDKTSGVPHLVGSVKSAR